ncbi:hypothetical protein HN695_00585, partial [Candidatus Woesearchaeota archaeon]|nr:hypothetical protein [Candidatus Woesearchaeota archaeon]MBT7926810.1 hypothetical protein [Candidatus Woesearchaeota archaeon]
MVWDTNLSISKLPNNIAEYFKKEADVLYSDLLSKKLRVVLVPAPRSFFEGHKIRAVECQNPGWYSELYHLYAHFKRSRCANALDRIRTGEDKNYRVHPFRYDARVRELILTRL